MFTLTYTKRIINAFLSYTCTNTSMQAPSLGKPFHPIIAGAYKALRRFENLPGWQLYAALLLTAFIFIELRPYYEHLQPVFWNTTFEKGAHLFENGHYPPGSHDAKLTFRFVAPAIIHYCHLGIAGSMVLFGLLGILNLYLVIDMSWLILRNKRFALLTGLCTALIYFGKFPFVNLIGNFYDALCLTFILLAFRTRSNVLRALLVFLAGFTDERGLICATLLVVFFVVCQPQKTLLQKLFSKSACSVYAGWALYVCVRMLLAKVFGLTTDGGYVGLDILWGQRQFIIPGLWCGLEGLWIPVAAALVLFARNKQLSDFILFLAAILIICFVGLVVIDIGRSMLYIFPAIFVAFKAMEMYATPQRTRLLLFIALLPCLLTPPYTVGSEHPGIWHLGS